MSEQTFNDEEGVPLKFRSSFLARALDLASIESLNRAFTTWVENDYNAQEYSVLGMRPIEHRLPSNVSLMRRPSCST